MRVAKILIVKASSGSRKLFRAISTLKADQVVALAGGDSVVATISNRALPLVIKDVQLPGRDGFAVQGAFNKAAELASTVATLTAHATAGDRERAAPAGFGGYITKPIDIRAVPEPVDRAMNVEMSTR